TVGLGGLTIRLGRVEILLDLRVVGRGVRLSRCGHVRDCLAGFVDDTLHVRDRGVDNVLVLRVKTARVERPRAIGRVRRGRRVARGGRARVVRRVRRGGRGVVTLVLAGGAQFDGGLNVLVGLRRDVLELLLRARAFL